MLKNDRWIKAMAQQGMIEPFIDHLVREVDGRKVISMGASSYGYDIRLSPKEFKIFRHIPGSVVNPKRFNPLNLANADLHEDEDGQFFILPANSYGLGVALERLAVPSNITIICLGKSTMARVGVVANVTPAEAGWQGHLTLEFSNSSSADVRMYANEGCLQLLFLEGEPCETTYADRFGKYQGQTEQIVMAKV